MAAMPLAAALALLLPAAGATPTPTPTPKPAPAPTPVLAKTPVPAAAWGGTKTLSDVAREQKLRRTPGEPAKKGSLSVASGSGGTAETSATPGPAEWATPSSGRLSPLVVVDAVRHNDAVGPNGQVRVEGSVRNAGNVPACDVVLTVRLHDDRGKYLVSGTAKADESLIRPGRSSSFAVWVQVPPGVAGSMSPTGPGSGPVSGSVTLEGNWRRLGRADGEILSVADSCPGEKPAE